MQVKSKKSVKKKRASSKPINKNLARYGENNASAKLTRYMVLSIRDLYHNKGISDFRLAMTFKVSVRTIRDIIERRTWTWLEG